LAGAVDEDDVVEDEDEDVAVDAAEKG